MGEFPIRAKAPKVIHTWTKYFPIGDSHVLGLSPTPASASWGTSGQAQYIPFRLPFNYPVRRLFLANGATATGNGCVSILDPDGVRLVTTGSVARSANAITWTSVTEYWLRAGQPYYLGVSISATTTAMYGTVSTTAPILRALGVLQQASAQPIPATATFAVPTVAAYPLAGFSRLP